MNIEKQLRAALLERNQTESWRYIAQQTGLGAGNLCGFATKNRPIGLRSAEKLADYLGLALKK